MKKVLTVIWETAKIIIISLVIIIPIRYYLIQPFLVKGASMEPSFDDGEYLIVDELSYHFSEPERGEVIVFKYPGDVSQYYIKRIVGLPNEAIEIKDGQIMIFNEEFKDGFVLNETQYLSEEIKTWGTVRKELGADEYFVLGDNRQASSDSRRWGVLPRDLIVGRVWLRAWPFYRASVF